MNFCLFLGRTIKSTGTIIIFFILIECHGSFPKSRIYNLLSHYVSPRVLYVVQAKLIKNSRAIISRVTGFGSFLASPCQLHPLRFSYCPRRVLVDRVISRGLASSEVWPRRRLRVDGERTRARARAVKLITTAPQTRNYVSTARHEPCYRITMCLERNLVFASQLPLQEKTIDLAGWDPILSLTGLGDARDFFKGRCLRFN